MEEEYVEPRFMRSSAPEVNYVLWFFVIALAVAAGNLLSAAAIGAYAEHQARQALAEANKVLRTQTQAAQQATQRARQIQAEQDASRRQQLRQQRAGDTTGSQLGRACAEWQQADSALNTETTRTELRRHCDRYERYLETGIVPRGR